jgi:hypothetical protein
MPRSQSAVKIFECVVELYRSMTSMPHYDYEFVAIIDNFILRQYLDVCQSKFDEIIRDCDVAKMLAFVVFSDPPNINEDPLKMKNMSCF